MIAIEENNNSEQTPLVVKSKRGRKSKKELMETLNLLNINDANMNVNKYVKSAKQLKNKNENEQKLSAKQNNEKMMIHVNSTINEKQMNNEKQMIDEILVSDEYLTSNENLISNENLTNDKKFIHDENLTNDEKITNNEEPKTFKKRGRKPKGGKIIQQNVVNDEHNDEKQHIILHLKCNMADLEENDSNETKDSLDAYNTHIYNDLMYNYQKLDEPKISSIINSKDDLEFDGNDDFNDDSENNKDNMKEIWKKLKQLECNLHLDNVSKKSACFWDTCDFDTPPIYIPKYFLGDTYYVYGCFCCPECAVAYLNREAIDRTTKSERYQLIHDVYSKIYDYKKSIKEASDPRYLLDKYLGNLSIKEYRMLSKTGISYLVIDKPLTKVYPEIHEDTEDYILNNKVIPSNTSTYQIRGKNGKKRPNKSSILSENFGIN